jgi:hypothetical protein
MSKSQMRAMVAAAVVTAKANGTYKVCEPQGARRVVARVGGLKVSRLK